MGYFAVSVLTVLVIFVDHGVPTPLPAPAPEPLVLDNLLYSVSAPLQTLVSGQTLEAIKGDSRHIEIRLVLNTEVDAVDSKKLRSVYVGRPLSRGVELFRLDLYNPHLPSVIIIHGFHGSADKHNPHLHALITNQYRQNYNLFALNMPLYFDWSPGNLWYLLPALRAKYGGEAVGEMLNQAIALDLLSADRLNLLGFSLGAQMAGYIARTVHGEVHSILGLDPAGPGFDTKLVQYNLLMTHVSKADARYVHMYHTNSNTFGSTQRVATADFIFNNGWHQPGCITSMLIMCSHRRACLFFTNIINSPHLFRAVRCSSYWDFRHCQCREEPVIPLSFPPDARYFILNQNTNSANGTYYLTTSSKVPYGEGSLGSMCPKDRLARLIKEGVITPKPALSFYDALSKLRPSVLFWGDSSKKRSPGPTWSNRTLTEDHQRASDTLRVMEEPLAEPPVDDEGGKDDEDTVTTDGEQGSATNIIQSVIAQNLS